ncbi:MAG: flagellar export chaperone FliS [Acidobacteriaceae bacterium]|nr:flagellar export chaperone FliS [Acidobacteriaceae bacterium]
MASNPYGAYLESKVFTASPLQLVHLAYEGAIEVIGEARLHLANKRIQERAAAITKAQRILTELQSSLDVQKGGQIATRLGQLYDYMQRRLIEANFKQADEPLAEVQRLLETVDQAWKEIAAAEMPVPQAVVAATASPWASSSDSFAYSRAEYTF